MRLLHLYPVRMNIYGDSGNVRALRQRLAWRGEELEVIRAEVGDEPNMHGIDLALIGGGEDHAQRLVARDLLDVKGPALRAAIEDGLTVLAICGGYQLLGEYYRPAEGDDLPGLGILPVRTVHPGPSAPRCIGNVCERGAYGTLVGFENHGGRTTLHGGEPLGKVVQGFGNNGVDHTEGCVSRNVFGTYLHGPILPKNPLFADHLLTLARQRRGLTALSSIDDGLETRAHVAIMKRMAVY